MATRVYLPSSGAAAFDTRDFSAYWNFIETSHVHLACGTAKTSTAQAYPSISTYTAPRTNNQFISGQWNAHDFTTSETVQAIIRALSDSATGTYIAMSIRVISADGGTVRGTLFEGLGPTAISNTAWTNRGLGALGAAVAIQNNVSMLAGDRLCIEVGAGGPTGAGVYPYFGDAAASDLAANETGTDAYNPWVEFSATLDDYSSSNPIVKVIDE